MFSLDSRSREPIYTQLEKNIIKYINLGIYEKDSMLPSVRNLALELGINPNTVSKAYKSLEQRGVVYTVAGKGVFVNGKKDLDNIQKVATDELKTVLKDAKNIGVDKASIINLVNELWGDEENDWN